jgi:hypothetical protein
MCDLLHQISSVGSSSTNPMSLPPTGLSELIRKPQSLSITLALPPLFHYRCDMTRHPLPLLVLMVLLAQGTKAEGVAKPNYPEILAPLINHQKLDTLKGKYQTPTEEPFP